MIKLYPNAVWLQILWLTLAVSGWEKLALFPGPLHCVVRRFRFLHYLIEPETTAACSSLDIRISPSPPPSGAMLYCYSLLLVQDRPTVERPDRAVVVRKAFIMWEVADDLV